MLVWCIALGFLVVVLLVREDEVEMSPTKKDCPMARDTYDSAGYTLENHVPTTYKETVERLKAFGVESYFKDYSRDEEFCRKHPCDYMKSYRFPDGRLTYCCTNEKGWERWGIKGLVLQGLNEGRLEMCARCAGLACYGERKPS